MSFARREVDRLVIEGDVGIALEQATKSCDVAYTSGGDSHPKHRTRDLTTAHRAARLRVRLA